MKKNLDMIRLNCFFQANDGEQFKTALQAAVALTEHSQKHEGCIAYDVFQSAIRKDVFLICETWEDQASFDKHAATVEPMVATLIGIFVFSEPLTLMSGIGVLLILAAVVILNVSNGNSRHGR